MTKVSQFYTIFEKKEQEILVNFFKSLPWPFLGCPDQYELHQTNNDMYWLMSRPFKAIAPTPQEAPEWAWACVDVIGRVDHP